MRRLGWSQGCTLNLTLPLRHLTVVDNQPMPLDTDHGLWLLVDQDCDLAWRALIGQDDPHLVELRPVFVSGAPTDWGIRNQQFRLDQEGRYLKAAAPAVRVTPDLLATATHLACLNEASQQRLKTWLGFRYDRPAVPQTYVDLAKALADQLSKKRHRASAANVRDVLAQFWKAEDGSTRYQLVAVLEGETSDANDEMVVVTRAWLAEATLGVEDALGSAVSIEAYGDEEVSLSFVERSFSLDLARLSWPPSSPGPVGVV